MAEQIITLGIGPVSNLTPFILTGLDIEVPAAPSFPGNTTALIRFRDKRAAIPFRDKRAFIRFRNKKVESD